QTQIEAEIANKGASLAIYDHVVDRAASDFREVDVIRHPPIGVLEERPLEHRCHDSLAGSQKTQACGDIWHLAQGLAVSVAVDPRDRARQTIDQPKKSVTPTRSFEV